MPRLRPEVVDGIDVMVLSKSSADEGSRYDPHLVANGHDNTVGIESNVIRAKRAHSRRKSQLSKCSCT